MSDRDDVRIQRWLWIILGVSVLTRVLAAFYLGDQVEVLPGTHDQISYDALARSLLAGKGFSFDQAWYPFTPANTPTAHWSYLYVLYVTGVYLLFGYHPLAARLIQGIATGILIPLLVYRLGCRLFNPRVGLVSAAIAALYAYFIYYSATLMTEPFHIVALLAVLEIALEIVEAPTQRRWILLGLALGLAILLRQIVLVFLPLLLLWLLWAGRGKIRLRDLGLPVLVVTLLILPWTVRNYIVYHDFLLLNSNAGWVFFMGNHPQHGTNGLSLYVPPLPEDLRGLNEAQLDRALMRRGLQFVLDDPGRYLLLSLSRVQGYFWFWPSPSSSLLSNVARVGSFGLALPFMLYGLILSARRIRTYHSRRAVILLYLYISSYTLVHLLTWIGPKYRLPVDAVLILFAGLGLVDIGCRLSRAWRGWSAHRGLKDRMSL
jgi:4-amino-4-deoxy-L-arabinose transferase-like glycosyltransferase